MSILFESKLVGNPRTNLKTNKVIRKDRSFRLNPQNKKFKVLRRLFCTICKFNTNRDTSVTNFERYCGSKNGVT